MTITEKRKRRPRGRLHLTKDERSGMFYITGTIIKGKRIRISSGTHSEKHAERKRAAMERRLLDEVYFGRKARADND